MTNVVYAVILCGLINVVVWIWFWFMCKTVFDDDGDYMYARAPPE